MSVLGLDSGYTVKYNPFPDGVPEGEAQSLRTPISKQLRLKVKICSALFCL